MKKKYRPILSFLIVSIVCGIMALFFKPLYGLNTNCFTLGAMVVLMTLMILVYVLLRKKLSIKEVTINSGIITIPVLVAFKVTQNLNKRFYIELFEPGLNFRRRLYQFAEPYFGVLLCIVVAIMLISIVDYFAKKDENNKS
jgi:hypothetical protein